MDFSQAHFRFGQNDPAADAGRSRSRFRWLLAPLLCSPCHAKISPTDADYAQGRRAGGNRDRDRDRDRDSNREEHIDQMVEFETWLVANKLPSSTGPSSSTGGIASASAPSMSSDPDPGGAVAREGLDRVGADGVPLSFIADFIRGRFKDDDDAAATKVGR